MGKKTEEEPLQRLPIQLAEIKINNKYWCYKDVYGYLVIKEKGSRSEQLSMSLLQSKSPKITVWLNCTWTDWSCSKSQLSFWMRLELGAKRCQDGLPTIWNHRLHWAPVLPQTIQIHSNFSEDLQSILSSSFLGKSKVPDENHVMWLNDSCWRDLSFRSWSTLFFYCFITKV